MCAGNINSSDAVCLRPARVFDLTHHKPRRMMGINTFGGRERNAPHTHISLSGYGQTAGGINERGMMEAKGWHEWIRPTTCPPSIPHPTEGRRRRKRNSRPTMFHGCILFLFLSTTWECIVMIAAVRDISFVMCAYPKAPDGGNILKPLDLSSQYRIVVPYTERPSLITPPPYSLLYATWGSVTWREELQW